MAILSRKKLIKEINEYLKIMSEESLAIVYNEICSEQVKSIGNGKFQEINA